MQIYTMPLAKPTRRVVGVIPAAGLATRLGPLSCSKEILPIASPESAPGESGHVVPVASYLLTQMSGAGASEVLFILRDGKWDIPATYGHGEQFGLNLGYVLMRDSWGPLFTLNQATPFVRDAIVLMGFPDVLLAPNDAFARALQCLDSTNADAVLGTFNAGQQDGVDWVQVTHNGHVSAVVPKEQGPAWDDNSKTWLLAVWNQRFTDFLDKSVRAWAKLPDVAQRDWPVGVVMTAALQAGLHIRAVHFDQGQFLDIGEPHRLAQADAFVRSRHTNKHN